MDDLNKRVLFEIESNLPQLEAEAKQLNDTLQKQQDQMQVLEFLGKRNTTEYNKLTSQISLTKDAIRQNNREINNSNKVFAASTNSIQQNRAALSVLVNEYIKASQKDGELSEKTLKLKANIDALTKTLKDQEKVFTTSRNVGNYSADVENALTRIIGSIPGLQQFSTVAQTATKVIGGFMPQAFGKASNSIMNFVQGNPGRTVIQGFGQMKQSAAAATEEIETTAKVAEGEAAAGMEGLGAASGEAAGGLGAVSAGAVATGGALLVLVGAIAGAYTWMQSLGSVAYKSGQIFAGVKASAISFFNDLNKQKGLKEIGADMKNAYNNAVELKKGMQELNARDMSNDEYTSYLDNQIAKNMLALRNRNITLEEGKKIDAEIETEEKERVDRKRTLAANELQIAINSAVNGKNLDEKTVAERKQHLMNLDLADIQHMENHDKINAGSTQKIHDARMKILAAQAEFDQLDQKRMNRMALLEQRFGKQSVKTTNETTNEMAEANKGWQQILQERVESTARILALNQDEFSHQLELIDAKYADLIYKENQFIAVQSKLAKLAKDPAAKLKFQQNAAGAKANVDMLQREHNTIIERFEQEHSDKMAQIIQRSMNQQRALMITGLVDQREKQKQQLELEYTEQIEALDNETEGYEKQIGDNKTLMQNASDDRKKQLQAENDFIQALIDQNGKKRDQLAGNYNQQLNDNAARNSFADLMDSDRAAEILAKLKDQIHPNKKNDDELFDAQNKTLDDRHNQDAEDLKQHKITLDQFRLLDAQYQEDKTNLQRNHDADRFRLTKENAQQIADVTFSFFKASLQHQQDAQEIALSNQKTHDLNNQALTETQRAEIEEKYRKEEGRAKVKAFRDNQKLSIAEAIIDGAIAALKTDAETGAIVGFALTPAIAAKTAAAVATIAAQQPPAYATGGVHYNSDGRGTLLNGPGTGTSDSMLARVSNGEAVINARSTMRFAPLLSAINVAGGGIPFSGRQQGNGMFWVNQIPRFATGGIMSGQTYLPTMENGLHNSNGANGGVVLHDNSINQIVNGMLAGVSQLPAPVVDVKDINYQQQMRTVSVSRGRI